MFTCELVDWEDLNEQERLEQPDSGSGADCACYLRILHNGKVVAVYSDAMEPEDCTFYRNLSWIGSALKGAYERGLADQEADHD